MRLIVNADDLGNGSCRDRGIFHAFNEGIVSSVSLLANGTTFTAAAHEALRLAVPLGVHLNLSEGRALNGMISGLTNDAGDFLGKDVLRQRLQSGNFDRNAVRREFLSQIARVREMGLTPDHLDTHQHCCLFPALTRLVLAVASETDITALRLSVTPAPLTVTTETDDLDDKLKADLTLYRHLATALVTAIKRTQLWCPDGLWGMPLLNRLNEKRLVDLLTRLPAGNWELMTHPGYSSASEVFSGPERELELAALTSPVVRELIATREIELTTFGACRCAC